MNKSIMELALRLTGDPHLEIGGCILYDHYFDIADLAIDEKWLVSNGINRKKYTHEGKFVDIEWCEHEKKYRYFSNDNWCYMLERSASRYKLNVKHLMDQLCQFFGMTTNYIIELYKEAFWYLGNQGSNNNGLNLYFLCSHAVIEYNEEIDEILNIETTRTPALIITNRYSKWVDKRLQAGMMLLELRHISKRNDDGILLDNQVLDTLQETLALNASSPNEGIKFSHDYRIVDWFGEILTFTRKQAAVVEELDKNEGKVHGDYLSAAAESNQSVNKIMRSRVNGKWTPHRAMGGLIIDHGESYFSLNRNARPWD